MKSIPKRPLIVTALLLVVGGITLGSVGCSSTIENREPVGEAFPQVRGQALSGEDKTLPDDLEKQPTVLLVGYVQDA